MQKILDTLYEFITTAGVRLLGAILVVVIGFVLSGKIAKKIRKSKKMDPTVASFFSSFFEFSVKAIILISSISMLGVEMTSIVAILASAGVAVGLALQGSLANIAGGILLVIFKPYVVGDYIKVAGEEGTVADISLFYTVLKKPDNITVCLPNGVASNASLQNLSTEGKRRVDFTVNVAYASDFDRVNKILIAIAANHELVLDDPAPVCYLSAFSDSSLTLSFRVWTKTENYWTVFFDINEAIDKAFRMAGVEIPFPQLDVHVNEKTPK